jgi:hypothetical protein
MRKSIFTHPYFIDENNLVELEQIGFVFLCMEGISKKVIVDFLVERKIPFIDVGIGVSNENNRLSGLARVTLSTATFHDHLPARINFSEGAGNEYSQNIQIADMNALNAALAVIRWKRLREFYADYSNEYSITYGIDTNTFTNDDFDNGSAVNQT